MATEPGQKSEREGSRAKRRSMTFDRPLRQPRAEHEGERGAPRALRGARPPFMRFPTPCIQRCSQHKSRALRRDASLAYRQNASASFSLKCATAKPPEKSLMNGRVRVQHALLKKKKRALLMDTFSLPGGFNATSSRVYVVYAKHGSGFGRPLRTVFGVALELTSLAAYDKLLRLASGSFDDSIIDHFPEFSRSLPISDDAS